MQLMEIYRELCFEHGEHIVRYTAAKNGASWSVKNKPVFTTKCEVADHPWLPMTSPNSSFLSGTRKKGHTNNTINRVKYDLAAAIRYVCMRQNSS
ncbi:hypothetical protein J6590_073694 [Homalodisca vitripennis]|nr:hypothetical protein J6590_073694 [Homalodisca vitripennis]